MSGAVSRSGLAVIRDLGRGGMDAIGLHAGRSQLKLRSRWSEPYRPLPRPWSVPALVRLLADARADALIPMESWLVRELVPARDRVERATALNVPDPVAFAAADDPRRTLALCAELGIPAPRLMQPGAVTLPAVVKPGLDVGGARGVSICRNLSDVEPALAACLPYGPPVIQEYVPGGPEQMRQVALLFDRDSRLIAHFTTRKLWTRPFDGGVMTLGVSTDDRDLVRHVMPFFEAVGWRGPAEVELKVDPRDGLAKVIEVNPRFPGYVGFAVRCGLHLPCLAARAALGEPAEGTAYAVGRKYLNPALHLKAVAGRVRRGPDRASQLAQAVRASWDAPWLSLQDVADPVPRLAKLLVELRAAWAGAPRGSDEPWDHAYPGE